MSRTSARGADRDAPLDPRAAPAHAGRAASPIDVFNLVTIEGIESRIADLVAEKQSLFESVFSDDVSALTLAP